jgi:hypothetical protein
MMMLEKLGLGLNTEVAEQDGLQRSLMQRLQAALDDPSTNPPPEAGLPVEPDAGLPVEPEKPDDVDMDELVRQWSAKMYRENFMMAAIFGDKDLFPTPDED